MPSNNFSLYHSTHTQLVFDVLLHIYPPFPTIANAETLRKVAMSKKLSLENFRDDFDEQQIDFVKKPITTIFKRLRNDDVWSGHEYGNCSDYCKECKNNKAQSIDDHCSIFPIFRHSSLIVLFSNLFFLG